MTTHKLVKQGEGLYAYRGFSITHHPRLVGIFGHWQARGAHQGKRVKFETLTRAGAVEAIDNHFLKLMAEQGFYIDEDGELHAVAAPGFGYHCEVHDETFGRRVVYRIGTGDFVDGEFTWYPTVEAVYEVLRAAGVSVMPELKVEV